MRVILRRKAPQNDSLSRECHSASLFANIKKKVDDTERFEKNPGPERLCGNCQNRIVGNIVIPDLIRNIVSLPLYRILDVGSIPA